MDKETIINMIENPKSPKDILTEHFTIKYSPEKSRIELWRSQDTEIGYGYFNVGPNRNKDVKHFLRSLNIINKAIVKYGKEKMFSYNEFLGNLRQVKYINCK